MRQEPGLEAPAAAGDGAPGTSAAAQRLITDPGRRRLRSRFFVVGAVEPPWCAPRRRGAAWSIQKQARV